MICEYRARGIFDVISIIVDTEFDRTEPKLKDEQYKTILTRFDANCHVEVV